MLAAAILAAQLAYPMFDAPTNRRLAKAPPAIGVFVERRAECAHWAGEEPYDKARAREIARAETKLRCDTVYADEAALRRRRRTAPVLLKLLDLNPDGG
jgi:hypothetical protein